MMAADAVAFELAVPPGSAPHANRACGLRGRTLPVTCTWHDTADRALAGRGLALGEWRGGPKGWRLERLWPEAGAVAPLGTPPARIAEAPHLAELDGLPRGTLLPAGGFSGRMRSGLSGMVHVTVLTGALRAEQAAGHALTAPCCRVLLSGPTAAVTALATELAALAGARAGGSLAAAALGVVPPARPGVPVLREGISASVALAIVCAHLSDVIAAQARPAAARLGTEPVHQMRVALRRLRSAIRVFKGVATGPELAGLSEALRGLGRVLGPARDWDVFLAGAGRDVAEAFADDAAVSRLLAAAARQRDAAYAALRAELEGPAFRQLGIRLALAALARPWEVHQGSQGEPAGETAAGETPPGEAPAGETPSGEVAVREMAAGDAAAADMAVEEKQMPDLREFAAKALDRRWRRVLAPGRSISGLELNQLHAIRLRAKRLRYAAELFAPLWGGSGASRFIRRVTAMQDRLGHLNDGGVAATLMAELGPIGRGRAGGIVEGFVTARAADAREKVERGWRKLRKAAPFWD